MGTLTSHIELKYTDSLTSGPRYITDSSYAITIPDGVSLVEYSPKILQSNTNDLSKPESRLELTGITTFLSIQSNRKVRLDVYASDGLTFSSLLIDRLFFSCSPYEKIAIINPDTVNSINLKVLFA